MKRIYILLVIPLLAACAQTTTTVHDSTIARQFAQMNKDGWAVSSGNQPRPAGQAADDPNVRVIREADFTGYRFNTNFQVNDSHINQQLQNQPPLSTPQPINSAANPWGTAPVITPVPQPGR